MGDIARFIGSWAKIGMYIIIWFWLAVGVGRQVLQDEWMLVVTQGVKTEESEQNLKVFVWLGSF